MIAFLPNGNDKCYVLNKKINHNGFVCLLVFSGKQREVCYGFYTLVLQLIFLVEWGLDEHMVRAQGEQL